MDADGRPWCEHGRAHKNGPGWLCPKSSAEKVARFRRTEKGRQLRQRENTSDAARSRTALYRLTYVKSY